MNEDQLIQAFFQTTPLDPSVILGVGDDAAVLDVQEGFQLAISTDTLIEGRHFPEGYGAADVASRAVGVCVSDLAAMGAIPKWVTLSLSMPKIDEDWLKLFSGSLHTALKHYSMTLVGGDTVKGPLSITLSVMGVVETGQALKRSTAQINDDVYVSGSLGGSAYALFRQLAHEPEHEQLMYLFAAPPARILLGRSLLRIATACMDVSDGILVDLSRLLRMSDVGAEIYLEKFPLHPAINDFPLDAQINFSTSGDDYELLFTAPETQRDEINALSIALDLPLTRIGKIVQDKALVTLSNGRVFDIGKHGYQHF